MRNNWDRLEEVIGWAGLNCHSFAHNVGLDSAQSLYQIKAGKHAISRRLAELICRRYPEVSYSWLLTGQGQMLNESLRAVPCLLDDCLDVATRYDGRPLGHGCLTTVPGCGDCDFAAFVRTAAMEPLVPCGALLYCKRVEVDRPVGGELCVVVYGSAASVVRYGGYDGRVVEVEYPTGERRSIDATLIRRLFMVRAVVSYTGS